MNESFKSNKYLRRVRFPVGKQRTFIIASKQKLGISYQELARLLGISIRTLTDWKREKFMMSQAALLRLEKRTKLPRPQVELLETYWHAAKGGKVAGPWVYARYKWSCIDERRRKNRWYEWWERDGKFNKNPILTKILVRIPAKTIKLAEFVGIVLGDGSISDRQLTITLHATDDKEYGGYVQNLIRGLFDVPVRIYKKKGAQANNYVVSRTALVQYCTEKLGLVKGNKVKQGFDITAWIKNNNEYSIACVRGLFDTDGGVVIHKYRVRGTLYIYRKLEFSSASHSLILSVAKILGCAGVAARIARPRVIKIESQAAVKKYFKIFGTHNPKHLKRYKG